jgi:hypothetical protein
MSFLRNFDNTEGPNKCIHTVPPPLFWLSCHSVRRVRLSCNYVYLFLLLPLEHRTSVKRFFSLQFHNLRHSVGLLEWGVSPSQGRYLHKQNKHRQISIPRVGFKHTIPVFERAQSDRATTVISIHASSIIILVNITLKPVHYISVQLLKYP